MKIAEKIDICRFKNGEFYELSDLTVNEMRLELKIKDVVQREMYCSPTELDELIWGHLFSQGYINSIDDVVSVTVDEQAAVAIAEINRNYTDSGVSEVQQQAGQECLFDINMIKVNQARFYEESTLQKETAGVHRCALCNNEGTLFACVDVSRHNAFDKVVGKALLQGVSLSDKYIITSGRVPYDMVKKAVNIHIPMIVSRSATTIAAVEAANKANMTLLGFSRDERFNIYCGKQRLY